MCLRSSRSAKVSIFIGEILLIPLNRFSKFPGENRNEILVMRIKDHPDDESKINSIKSALDEEFRIITATSL